MTGLHDAAAVSALLGSAGLLAGPVTLARLNGGYLNEVLLVESGDRKMVLKYFAEPMQATLFPNLPESEAEAARRLAPLDVAPAMLGFWPDQQALLCEYVSGGAWEHDLESVAALLLRKESADPSGFRKVSPTPAEILAEGDRFLARAGGLDRPSRPQVIEVPAAAKLSLIHTDVGAANLVGCGTALRLVDWQCAAAGDLCEDIFSFLAPSFQVLSERAPFTRAERARFFAALGRPDIQERYAALEPFFAWRMLGYCALRAQLHPEAAIRARYQQAMQAELGSVANRT